MERTHHAGPARSWRRLLVRLGLLVSGGGLLLLLSAGSAGAADRREPGLLVPVGKTLEATARHAGSLAGRTTGSGPSTADRPAAVHHTADRPAAVRHAVAPTPRPAATAVRSTARSTIERGAPAATSPVRRPAPLTRTAASPVRRAVPLTRTATSPVRRAASLATAAASTVRRAAPLSTIARLASLVPQTGPVGDLVEPLLPGGLVPVQLPLVGGPLPTPTSSSPPVVAGPAADLTVPTGAGPAALDHPAASKAAPAGSAAGSHEARPVRSWPAPAGAVRLPGAPASAELPAGGPDPLSSSPGAGLGLAALTAALLLLGPAGRGRVRPERSSVISRSYLPLVSPA